MTYLLGVARLTAVAASDGRGPDNPVFLEGNSTKSSLFESHVWVPDFPDFSDQIRPRLEGRLARLPA